MWKGSGEWSVNKGGKLLVWWKHWLELERYVQWLSENAGGSVYIHTLMLLWSFGVAWTWETGCRSNKDGYASTCCGGLRTSWANKYRSECEYDPFNSAFFTFTLISTFFFQPLALEPSATWKGAIGLVMTIMKIAFNESLPWPQYYLHQFFTSSSCHCSTTSPPPLIPSLYRSTFPQTLNTSYFIPSTLEASRVWAIVHWLPHTLSQSGRYSLGNRKPID